MRDENSTKDIEADIKEMADDVLDESTAKEPEWPEEPGEEATSDNFMANSKIILWLSTDGKNTVQLETNETVGKLRKQAIAKTMELYDFVLARYGTKQAQAVKEYGKDNGTKTLTQPQSFAEKDIQENCPHTNVKFVESHTEKNPGRWFKTCADCKAFLGWQV